MHENNAIVNYSVESPAGQSSLKYIYTHILIFKCPDGIVYDHYYLKK